MKAKHLFPLALLLLLAPTPALRAAEGDDKTPEEKAAAAAAPVNANAPQKLFSYNCEAWELGVPPKDVFVVDGTIKVASHDGSKCLMVDASPIVDATAQLGDSAAGSATIEARIFASKRGRSYPRFGLSVHGMAGYRVIVNCAKRQLELIKDDATVKSVPFAWTNETWTKLKLSAEAKEGGKWLISAKAWPMDGNEPTEPMLTEATTGLKGQGKCAFWGTPFAETPLYFDDIKVSVAAK